MESIQGSRQGLWGPQLRWRRWGILLPRRFASERSRWLLDWLSHRHVWSNERDAKMVLVYLDEHLPYSAEINVHTFIHEDVSEDSRWSVYESATRSSSCKIQSSSSSTIGFFPSIQWNKDWWSCFNGEPSAFNWLLFKSKSSAHFNVSLKFGKGDENNHSMLEAFPAASW
jgi:hypothetical protein